MTRLTRIARLQNDDRHITLLAAQRQMYRNGKVVQRWRVVVTVVLALASPILAVVLPDTGSVLASAAGIWLLISRLLLEEAELSQVRKGANVQEQFDVSIFGLTWNSLVVGAPVPQETISAAARRYRGDRAELRNWYSCARPWPRSQEVLACQMSNLSWDGRLRQAYGTVVLSLTTILFAAGIVVGLAFDKSLIDYLLGVFFPSVPALLKGIETAKAHRSVARRKWALHSILAELVASLSRGQRSPSAIHRELQDVIYRLRCERPVVPDWCYSLFRKDFQRDTDYFHSTLQPIKSGKAARG